MPRSKLRSKIQTILSFIQPKDVRKHRRADVELIQNVRSIWLDSNIDEHSSDCQNTIARLRCAVNAVNIFTDGDECIRSLDDMCSEKVCMIVSGALGQEVIPRVHDLSQIDSIFIFCDNKAYHEEWVKQWPKIKGVFTEIQPICDALRKKAQLTEQNAVSMSFISTNEISPNKSLDHLDPTFMYTMIMKEILLTIDFEQQHIDEFIQHCRQAFDGNPSDLTYVDELAQVYCKERAIWWYTRPCFLYPMLNGALRAMDADLMLKLGFFISDLHRQIQELHREQFSNNGSNQKFTLYRGQAMDKKEFDQMVATEGGLLAFNCFLSTSRNRQVSEAFAGDASPDTSLVPILFVMTIDLTLSDTPFASVDEVGALGEGEEEMLFSMNSVFRIATIKQVDDNPALFCVELTLTGDKDDDLRQLIDRIRIETFPDEQTGWFPMGLILKTMGMSVTAQHIFETLLAQTIDDTEQGTLYHQLGIVTRDQGHYNEANTYFEKAITIERPLIPPNHSKIADCYTDMSLSFYQMGALDEALSSSEKAIQIRQLSQPVTHPDFAPTYNAIALAYSGVSDTQQALSCHEKALAMREQSLPSTHPDLAHSYSYIGNVYYQMGKYQQALSYYEKALEICQRSLPSTHPELAASYNNIGTVHESKGSYQQALSYHEKALQIWQQSLCSTHPDLATTYPLVLTIISFQSTFHFVRVIILIATCSPFRSTSIESCFEVNQISSHSMIKVRQFHD